MRKTAIQSSDSRAKFEGSITDLISASGVDSQYLRVALLRHTDGLYAREWVEIAWIGWCEAVGEFGLAEWCEEVGRQQAMEDDK